MTLFKAEFDTKNKTTFTSLVFSEKWRELLQTMHDLQLFRNAATIVPNRGTPIKERLVLIYLTVLFCKTHSKR
jgi:hypothetical protein